MNENIDLTKILENCPKGTKFYSTIFGEVEFLGFCNDKEYAVTIKRNCSIANITKDGRYISYFNGECTLFPSKEQRDWSKFTAPWYKKKRFDHRKLKPFDKVLVKIGSFWQIELFSHICKDYSEFPYQCARSRYAICIPYNDDTKHLVGTTDEAPEYYRYWEE